MTYKSYIQSYKSEYASKEENVSNLWNSASAFQLTLRSHSSQLIDIIHVYYNPILNSGEIISPENGFCNIYTID